MGTRILSLILRCRIAGPCTLSRLTYYLTEWAQCWMQPPFCWEKLQAYRRSSHSSAESCPYSLKARSSASCGWTSSVRLRSCSLHRCLSRQMTLSRVHQVLQSLWRPSRSQSQWNRARRKSNLRIQWSSLFSSLYRIQWLDSAESGESSRIRVSDNWQLSPSGLELVSCQTAPICSPIGRSRSWRTGRLILVGHRRTI